MAPNAMEGGISDPPPPAHLKVLAIITGPVVNLEKPDDDPSMNAYFNRPYCGG